MILSTWERLNEEYQPIVPAAAVHDNEGRRYLRLALQSIQAAEDSEASAFTREGHYHAAT